YHQNNKVAYVDVSNSFSNIIMYKIEEAAEDGVVCVSDRPHRGDVHFQGEAETSTAAEDDVHSSCGR
ncbi:hypothetical protein BaRGS_00011244, partial [Batillaria attramentaria]